MSLEIPDSVTSIGVYAFQGCTAEIIWGDDPAIKEIGDGAFASYAGTSISIPNSVTSIGEEAFLYCSSLTSVSIPNSVTSIGNSAFNACSSLTSVTIPNSITRLTDGVFMNTGLISVTIPDSVTVIERNVFYGCDSLTSVTIPNSVTSIGYSAFGSCPILPSVAIPDSVRSIGEYAFSWCYGLTSVTIGSGVTSIGSNAFDKCYKLIEVYNRSNLNITAGSTAYGYVGYYAKNVYNEEGVSQFTDTSDGFRFFYDGTNAYLMGYYGDETELTLPTGFTAYDGTKVTEYAIYDYAFHWNMDITSVIISDNVTGIGDNAFAVCNGLTSVTFEETAGWYVTEDSAATSGTSLSSSSLSNKSTAATWLTSTYASYYWKR